MSNILTSAIATELYSGTLISVTFSVVELDCDIVQALVNCASVAMLNSTIKCRFLPVSVCLLQQSMSDQDKLQSVSIVDPSVSQLANQVTFSQKLRLVFNVDTEELSYSSMESLKHGSVLDLESMERTVGTGLSAARKLHKLILQSQVP